MFSSLRSVLPGLFAGSALLGWALLLAVACPLRGQSLQIVDYNYEQGLPTNLIKKTIQDSTGFIWIASDDGVVRFDGENFKVYTIGLPSRFIKDLCITRDGALLAVTDLGISRMENPASSDSFALYIPGHSESSDSALFYPKSVYEDRSGTLWIGENNDIVCYREGKLRRYPLERAFVSESFARASLFFEDERGRLFATSEKGYLLYYNPDHDAFEALLLTESQANVSIHALLHLPGGKIWAGGSNGLFELRFTSSLSGMFWKPLPFTQTVSALKRAPSGEVYIGSWRSGLYRWAIGREGALPRKIQEFPHQVVNDLFFDRDGELWVSSDDGLTIVHPSLFQKITLDTPNYFILALAATPQGTVFASEGESVYKLNGESGSIVSERIYAIPDGRIASLASDGRQLWIGNNKGAAHSRGRSLTACRHPHRSGRTPGAGHRAAGAAYRCGGIAGDRFPGADLVRHQRLFRRGAHHVRGRGGHLRPAQGNPLGDCPAQAGAGWNDLCRGHRREQLPVSLRSRRRRLPGSQPAAAV